MDRELFEWLEKEFRIGNLPKYQKYYIEWVTNITQNQIKGFQKQKESQENQSMIQH